jgi:glycosyltransferase involved in cell wall biosynthesis
MKIDFLIASFFPHATGATHSAHRLACRLRETGHRVSFLVNDQGPEWRNGGSFEGFPVQSFRLQGPGKCSKAAGIHRLIQHVRRQPADLYHVQGGGHVNLFAAEIIRRATGRPVVMKITLDGWDTPDGVRSDKWGSVTMACYRRLAGVVAMTSGQASKCRGAGLRGEIRVIPNGVDCERFRPADAAERVRLRERLGLPLNVPLLAYAGWLGHRKGTDVLFGMLTRLRSLGHDPALLLVGDYMQRQDDRPDLRALLAESGLSPALLLDPRVINRGASDAIEDYLRASDLFVFPSRQEGFGTVQIEAMACGLPCLVNDLPGVSCDIFPTEEYGFRIADNRVDTFAELAAGLLLEPERRARIGKAARARAEEHFSIAAVAGRYQDLYSHLLTATARS